MLPEKLLSPPGPFTERAVDVSTFPYLSIRLTTRSTVPPLAVLAVVFTEGVETGAS